MQCADEVSLSRRCEMTQMTVRVKLSDINDVKLKLVDLFYILPLLLLAYYYYRFPFNLPWLPIPLP